MLTFRMATISDIDLIYNWSNDPLVRESSYNSEPINYHNHQLWYANKMSDENKENYDYDQIEELYKKAVLKKKAQAGPQQKKRKKCKFDSSTKHRYRNRRNDLL